MLQLLPVNVKGVSGACPLPSLESKHVAQKQNAELLAKLTDVRINWDAVIDLSDPETIGE